MAKKHSPSGGLEPPTFRLTVERASQLRHEGLMKAGNFHIFCISGSESFTMCVVCRTNAPCHAIKKNVSGRVCQLDNSI